MEEPHELYLPVLKNRKKLQERKSSTRQSSRISAIKLKLSTRQKTIESVKGRAKRFHRNRNKNNTFDPHKRTSNIRKITQSASKLRKNSKDQESVISGVFAVSKDATLCTEVSVKPPVNISSKAPSIEAIEQGEANSSEILTPVYTRTFNKGSETTKNPNVQPTSANHNFMKMLNDFRAKKGKCNQSNLFYYRRKLC